MAKLKSTLLNMFLSLVLISAIMSLALGFVYLKTKGPIEQADAKKVSDAISAVVPQFDNDPVNDKVIVEDVDIYPAKVGDSIVGYAVKTYTNKGFSGYIGIMIGISPAGAIQNISILSQKETPGLGSKMIEAKFKNQFTGKSADSFKFKVKKDGGDVDAITAATISSRAFCDAINRAYDALKKGGLK